MKFTLQAYGLCELGQRSNQEDALFPELGKINADDRLFLVCDGMGGHESGEVASNLVCQTMSRSVLQQCPDAEGPFSDQNFEQALSDALSALALQPSDGERKMGTTLTFLKFHDQGCTIAHIGDSRVYHIRPGQGEEDTDILFQTEDHSLMNDLIRMGEFTKEESRNFGMKNVITRALQPKMERRPKADFHHTSDIRPGDYFLLCSDGILEEMEDRDLKRIFSRKGGVDLQKVATLRRVTVNNKDNHSAIIVHVREVKGPLPQPVASPQAIPDTGAEIPVHEAQSAAAPVSERPKDSSALPSAKDSLTVPAKEMSKKAAQQAQRPSTSRVKGLIITVLAVLSTLEALYLILFQRSVFF